MLKPEFTYADTIASSIKVWWNLDDVLPPDTVLDFSRPHLPNALAASDDVSFLAPEGRLALNHIRGNSYMNLLGFVEEYIIAQTVQHAQAEMFGDHEAIRALLRFGEEEIKHQTLFRRYCEIFARDFGTPCDVLSSPSQVAAVILDKSPLAVMMVTLQLELMTQQHYTDSVRDAEGLDPLFARILKHHWLEESQHARIDQLEIAKMYAGGGDPLVTIAISDYFDLLDSLDGLLCQQVEMDADNLSRKLARELTPEEREELTRVQRASYRRDFLIAGMDNPQFKRTIAALSASGHERLLGKIEEVRGAP